MSRCTLNSLGEHWTQDTGPFYLTTCSLAHNRETLDLNSRPPSKDIGPSRPLDYRPTPVRRPQPRPIHVTAKPGRIHPPNDPSHPHDPHDTGETGGLHARTIRPTCLYCFHHPCPLPAHDMRLAVGLSSQFIQPAMAQYKQTIPLCPRPGATPWPLWCGAGSVCPRPVATPWDGPAVSLRPAAAPRAPTPGGAGPVSPRPGAAPLFLAPAAAPCPTVRKRLRVPPSARGSVIPPPYGPRVPPCHAGGGRVSPRGGPPPVSPSGGGTACSPGRGGHVVSPRPCGGGLISHRPGAAPRVPPLGVG